MTNLPALLNLWQELTTTGSDLIHRRSNTSMDEYNHQIQEAVAADSTHLLGYTVLQSSLNAWLKDHSLKLLEGSYQPDRALRVLSITQELKTSLDDSGDFASLKDRFELSLRKALDHYGVSTERQQKILSDLRLPLLVRRDALRSLNTFTAHKLATGRDTDASAPHFSKLIYRFFSYEEAMQLAGALPQGISAGVLDGERDFEGKVSDRACFLIRRGGTIVVLVDPSRQTWMEPKPYEDLDQISNAKQWFPYNLASAIKRGKVKSLVVADSPSTSFANITDLSDEQMLWFIYFYEMLMQKYWQPESLAALPEHKSQSMIVQGVMSKQNSLQIYTQYPSVFSVADMNTSRLEKHNFWPHTKPQGLEWMEQKYASCIPDEWFERIQTATPDTQIAFAVHDDQYHVITQAQTDSASYYTSRFVEWLKFKYIKANALSTPEDLIYQRLYTARANYARLLSAYARKEKGRILPAIREFIESQISLRKDLLLKAVINAPEHQLKDSDGVVYSGIYEIPKVIHYSNYKDYHKTHAVCFGQKVSRNSDNIKCFLTGAKSKYVLFLEANSLKAAQWILGLDRESLPEEFMYMYDPPKLGGIEGQGDPFADELKNPWSVDRTIEYVLSTQTHKAVPFVSAAWYVSASAYKQLKKQYEVIHAE